MPAQTQDAHASSAGSTLPLPSALPSFPAARKKPGPGQPRAGPSPATRPLIAALDQARPHASHFSPPSPAPPPSSPPAAHRAPSHPQYIPTAQSATATTATAATAATAPDLLLPDRANNQGQLPSRVPPLWPRVSLTPSSAPPYTDLTDFDPASFGLRFSPTGALYAAIFGDLPDPIAPPSPYPLPIPEVSLPPPAQTDRAAPSMSEPPADSGEPQPQQPPRQEHGPPLAFPLTLQNATSASNSPASASGHLPPQPPPHPPAFTLPPLPPGLVSGSDAHTHPYPLLPPSAYGPLPPSRKRTRSPSDSSTSEQRGYADLPFADTSPTHLLAEGSTRPRRSSLPSSRSGSRVQLACVACRNRKIKCNGEKPICENCVRRGTICEYDAQPRRRGPDKKPGGRVRKKELAAAQAQAIAEGRPPPLASPDDEPESPKRRRRADTGPREGMVPGLPMPPYPYGPHPAAYADPRFASMYGAPPPPPPPHMEYGYGPPPQYMYPPPREGMGWLPPPFEAEMQRQESARRRTEERDPDPVQRSEPQPPAGEETRPGGGGDTGREDDRSAEPAQREEGEERGEQGADPAASATAGAGPEAATPAGEDKGKGRAVDTLDDPLGLIADPGADADEGTM
ncbi:hypothetical protein CALCODRAFT_487475 [Calocera cornea HHB12733]|uniref:Zn(2)-C6 fungal-type domain-containing protein n=1 Tax=Calocera cornea HHB12733 TaxID=1353952 RepID=A0A165D3E5_9BASI|nr:hypothetical protein CALCODRAFT_487475 [Calocera cornea HHB12733]